MSTRKYLEHLAKPQLFNYIIIYYAVDLRPKEKYIFTEINVNSLITVYISWFTCDIQNNQELAIDYRFKYYYSYADLSI